MLLDQSTCLEKFIGNKTSGSERTVGEVGGAKSDGDRIRLGQDLSAQDEVRPRPIRILNTRKASSASCFSKAYSSAELVGDK